MTGHSVNSEMSDRSGDYGDYRNAFNRTVWPVPKSRLGGRHFCRCGWRRIAVAHSFSAWNRLRTVVSEPLVRSSTSAAATGLTAIFWLTFPRLVGYQRWATYLAADCGLEDPPGTGTASSILLECVSSAIAL